MRNAEHATWTLHSQLLEFPRSAKSIGEAPPEKPETKVPVGQYKFTVVLGSEGPDPPAVPGIRTP